MSRARHPTNWRLWRIKVSALAIAVSTTAAFDITAVLYWLST